MSSDSLSLGQRLVDLRLVTRSQIDETMAAGTIESEEELLRSLERRSLLTPLQIQKYQKGETSGYFVGHYRLLYKIAAGGFARVYRGDDTRTGEVVAIKILRDRLSSNPEAVRQFQREAAVTKSLSHPNITRTIEVAIDPTTNQHYIVMEFVEGGNFKEFLKIRQKIEPAEFIRFATEMLEGLRYALSRGVTHRDIRLKNVLISARGQVKWVDFGLAGAGAADDTSPSTEARTIEYAALERATGVPKGDPRSDIFFLGTVFYQMLTGESPLPPPPKGRTGAAVIRPRFDQCPSLLSRSDVPPEIGRIVDRMMAFRAETRYQRYEDILADLAPLAGGSPPAAAGTSDHSLPAATGPRRVFVVHRDPRAQELIKKKIASIGYQVVLTNDIERAMSLSELKPADCFIIDLKTIGLDGLKSYATSVQKKRAGSRHVAIFISNGNEQTGWVESLRLARAVTLDRPTAKPLVDKLTELVPLETS